MVSTSNTHPDPAPNVKPIARKRLTKLRDLHRDDRGATTLEWTLLLAAVALPTYFAITLGVQILVAHYQMITTLNAMPLP